MICLASPSKTVFVDAPPPCFFCAGSFILCLYSDQKYIHKSTNNNKALINSVICNHCTEHNRNYRTKIGCSQDVARIKRIVSPENRPNIFLGVKFISILFSLRQIQFYKSSFFSFK